MTRYRLLAAFAALALPAPAMACPKADIHAETARFVQMGAGGQPGARAYDARLSAPQVTCANDGATLKIVLSFKVDASLGPNVEAKPVQAPYFVAVLYGGKIVAKEVFPVRLPFGPGAETVSLTETVDKISLPLRRNAKPDYEILLGFQLTPQQLRAGQN